MTETDFSLQKLFDDYQPDLGSDDEYLARLSRRLGDIELVRLYGEQRIRRYRMSILVALVVGILSGGVGMFLILSLPDQSPLFPVPAKYPLLSFFSEYGRTLSVVVISVLCGIATLALVRVWQRDVERRQPLLPQF